MTAKESAMRQSFDRFSVTSRRCQPVVHRAERDDSIMAAGQPANLVGLSRDVVNLCWRATYQASEFGDPLEVTPLLRCWLCFHDTAFRSLGVGSFGNAAINAGRSVFLNQSHA
jgi:hypothetical protein